MLISDRCIPEPNSGCLIWLGHTAGFGYGRIHWKHTKETLAHRIAWVEKNGPIPAGKYVLHKCDVPCCCNPDHLFLGSQQDNIKDRDAKGRQRSNPLKGINSNFAKLSEKQVLQIRLAKGLHREIAIEYGVAPSTITRIKNGRRWGHFAS